MDPKMTLVTGGLNTIGFALKKNKYAPNWAIPFILLILGAAAGVLIEFVETNKFSLQGVYQGLYAATASVFLNQAFKQLKQVYDLTKTANELGEGK